ncbi:hypothetical protein KQI38_06390 [Tissierella carlieri]|uniref:hypothetical protein n=1 Tax=Tissierella TaxID=41273 RepID=UPI001C1122D9|nr:hypothetical protein [Tissierella carlieri]MBU5311651.1 hypothetical protein [Tissierella carlieri]
MNDVLWNKDGEIGEEGKNNEYQPMGEPPMLTDNCACAYGDGGPCFTPFFGIQKMCD